MNHYLFYGIAVACVAVFIIVYLIADKAIQLKSNRDVKHFNASKASSVAEFVGFGPFADFLRWYAVGNIKHTLRSLENFFNTYCLDPRGPVKLAHDVFMHTWKHLRVDAEYGNAVRAEVISDALGVDINDKTDVIAAKAADRAASIGWSHVAKMGTFWAQREFTDFTNTAKGLFDEFMETDGEVKIAMSVARPTFAALWNSKVDGAHATAQSLVEEKAAELGWTPPAAKSDNLSGSSPAPVKQAA